MLQVNKLVDRPRHTVGAFFIRAIGIEGRAWRVAAQGAFPNVLIILLFAV
jgi:hypothetical protein